VKNVLQRIKRITRFWERAATAPGYIEEQWEEVRARTEQSNRESKELFHQAEQVGVEAMQKAFAAHDQKFNSPPGQMQRFYDINKEIKIVSAIQKRATNDEMLREGLRQYLAEKPNSSMARMGLGRLYLKAGNLQAAEQEFREMERRAETEEPNRKQSLQAEVRLALAQVTQAQGKHDEARRELLELAKENRVSDRYVAAQAYALIGDGYKEQGQLRNARKAWNQAMRTEPADWFVQFVQKRLRETA
jgi:tetratricopeptide (TPR) repeat protein